MEHWAKIGQILCQGPLRYSYTNIYKSRTESLTFQEPCTFEIVQTLLRKFHLN